jgi:excisionase family DNA binding protein
MKQLMNVEDAARVLNISPWTVRSYIAKGRIRPVRIGRRVLLEEVELERIISQSKGSAMAEVQRQAGEHHEAR